ncbi:MAG: hypothetical protein KQH57_19520 [Actinomycetales bacterium]|nr:hypothetical protein [Actinomycetales bacterium]
MRQWPPESAHRESTSTRSPGDRSPTRPASDPSNGRAPARTRGLRAAGGATLSVAVVRFPRVSNATGVDAVAAEPGVDVWVTADTDAVARADLVVLPGTRATVADLAWMRSRGLGAAVLGGGALADRGRRARVRRASRADAGPPRRRDRRAPRHRGPGRDHRRAPARRPRSRCDRQPCGV